MTTLTITAIPTALFTPELRNTLAGDLAPGNSADVIGVGDSLYVEGPSADDVRSALTPTAWVFPDGSGKISRSNIYHAAADVQRQAATAYFAAWGNATYNATVDAKLLEMAALRDEGEPSFDVICLSFGVLVLNSNPTIGMCIDAADAGEDRITQDVVDMNIALMIDSSISAHASVSALARAQTFIDTMVEQTLGDRRDRDRWDPFFDGISFRVSASTPKEN